MPGGRPKNCWRPGRERKLVRLYVLSSLNLDEIQKVLKASGFDPSTSDMQKKLRALLPKDYARDYRRYRPSSRQNARNRLLHVKCCTDGRVRKCRGLRSQAPGARRDRAGLRATSSNSGTPEGCASAFRNYSTSSSPTPGTHISMSWLDMSSMQLDTESNPERDAIEYTQRIHKLRREAVFTASPPPEIQSHPTAPPTIPIKSRDNPAITLNRDSRMGEDESQVAERQRPFPTTETSSIVSDRAETSSDSLSIRSLGRRLARRYSQSTMEHIASILQSSSTSSRRSSLLSLISFVSSKVSSKVSIEETPATAESKVARAVPSGPKFLLRKGKISLTNGEQRIWEDLVDESQLAQSSREIPRYLEISLTKRSCCGMSALLSCEQCGFSEVHRWAITTVKEPSASVPFPTGLSAEFAQERDHFGNTPLHFVAANASGSAEIGWPTIKWLIEKGANVKARNTSGETFMHVLRREHLKHTEEYADLLLKLRELKFPFAQRDYHGQTLCDIFFATINPRDIPPRAFQIIFSHLIFDANVKYLAEFWRQTAKDSDRVQEARSDGARQLATLVAQGYKPLPSFQSGNFWSRRTDTSDVVKELDVNGDSALIYIVKAWREKEDERQLAQIISSLVTAGAEIPMRDRWGDTALAVAARRGLRPAVKTLLCGGANPNVRNYHGRGILSQARECLRQAKYEENSSRYAMILSCIALLTDYGAKEQPSAYDEFLSPTSMARVRRAPGIV